MAKQRAELGIAQWEQVWQNGETRWDLGGVTPALVTFLREQPAHGNVLVPGCGAGHDAYYWAKQGARVVAVDFAPSALAAAQARYQHTKITWTAADVTQLGYADQFDWVWEYTCFCALHPEARADYLDGINRALKPGGSYVGMVFSKVPKDAGPPFAVAAADFRELLAARFTIEMFTDPAPQSIKPRRGREIWFHVTRSSAPA